MVVWMHMGKTNQNPHLPELQKRVAQAPTDPGVYRWLDDEGTILYVGKAKNLRNRLRSYVQKADKSLGPWKLSLIERIADFDVTVVTNELEALVLETNLIKEQKPKYNVMMKDDKNYVYVRISNEPFPAVSVVRQMADDDAKYFGPYISAYNTRKLLDALHMIYDYREDAKALERLNKAAASGNELQGVRPSLAYQIGQSCGVSIGKISPEEYRQRIEKLVRFYKGHVKDARQQAEKLMQEAASNKKFERAATLRDAVQLITDLEEKQLASGTAGENTDSIGLAFLHGKTQAVVLRERQGRIVDDRGYPLKGSADTVEEALQQFLQQYYSNMPVAELPDAVVLPRTFDGAGLLAAWLHERKGKKVDLLLPERGKKAQLLALAQKNAEEKLKQQEARWEAAAKNIATALTELQDILNVPTEPKRIEGYDISHLGGTETVGSMVVATNGKPNNAHYRSFTIQTVREGEIDDYKALAEVLRRRLRHLADDLKTQEINWNEQGITFGKARKAEQQWLKDHLASHPEIVDPPLPAYTNFLVARKNDRIIGTVALRDLDGCRELTALWVDEEERNHGLAQFLCRKILHKLKKGKVYLLTAPHRFDYYGSLGFRHVHTPPKAMAALVERNADEQQMAMMYDAAGNKPDSSLSDCPDLLVIDGGKGQLSAAVSVLQELQLDIPVIGLAKREEEVFQPGQSAPTVFPKDSQAKFLLMRLRNEAHRFANRHREKRLSKKAIGSALDDVPGIGPKTRQELLNAFGTVAGVQQASDADLLQIVSPRQLAEIRRMQK